MKRNFVLCAIAACLLLTATGFAQAQDTTTTQQTTTTTTSTSDNSASTMPDSTTATPTATTSPDTNTSTTVDTQDNTTTTGTQSNDSNVRTLTGCLRRGDSSSEYELMGRDGSTWELKSDAVDLASHVGHTVTITGAVRNANLHGMKEDMKKEANEHGVGSSTEHGHMTVTNVTMVSNSCS